VIWMLKYGLLIQYFLFMGIYLTDPNTNIGVKSVEESESEEIIGEQTCLREGLGGINRPLIPIFCVLRFLWRVWSWTAWPVGLGTSSGHHLFQTDHGFHETDHLSTSLNINYGNEKLIIKHWATWNCSLSKIQFFSSPVHVKLC
jgi:hypothetical protein